MTTGRIAAAHVRFRLRQYKPHLIHASLAHPSPQHKRHLDRFSRLPVFAGLTTVTDRPTDHATWSVTIGRIYVRISYIVLRWEKSKTKSIKAIQIYQRTGYNITFTAPTLMCGRHEILHMAATYMVSQKVKFHLFLL